MRIYTHIHAYARIYKGAMSGRSSVRTADSSTDLHGSRARCVELETGKANPIDTSDDEVCLSRGLGLGEERGGDGGGLKAGADWSVAGLL